MVQGGHTRLTEKQQAVMERIDRRESIKLIADELGVSESRINQHIRKIKDAYRAENLRDLVNKYRAENGGIPPIDPYRKPASINNQLPEQAAEAEYSDRVDQGDLVFSDALAFPAEAPWQKVSEPQVVPGMLDGDQAVTMRIAVMIAIAFGLVTAVILVVTASVSMTEALDGKARVPVEKIEKPAG